MKSERKALGEVNKAVKNRLPKLKEKDSVKNSSNKKILTIDFFINMFKVLILIHKYFKLIDMRF